MLIRKISLLGLLVLVAVYAIAVIGRPTISPEISEAFVTLSKTKTLGEALGKFLVFDENWYRPLTFYLTNFFVFRLIDIHSIYLIKTLSLLGILLNAYVVTELALTIFGSSLIERMVIFALVVSHPLYFSIAYEGSGIVDPVFNIALNLFL
ncbi:MAG: hypothetical protein ACXWOH_13695, partial [Bdellovibrionota bacterium]